MRSVLVLVAVTLGSFIVPAAADGTLLADTDFRSDAATPMWSSSLGNEARVWRVQTASFEGVQIEATVLGTDGRIQLHVYHDVAAAFMTEPGRFDPVPATVKSRIVTDGAWLVAVDPSVPLTTVRVEFRGDPVADKVTFVGAWRCPFDPSAGCMP